jgi:hypothetical protein
MCILKAGFLVCLALKITLNWGFALLAFVISFSLRYAV